MDQKGNFLAGGSGENCTELVQFPARLAALPDATTWLAHALQQQGLAPGLVARAQLVLEELMRNSVLHGYGGDSEQPVWIGVQGASLLYLDSAPPFDPVQNGPAPLDTNAPLATLRVGGIGLQLIRQLGSSIQYHYAEGRNCIRVSFRPNP